MTTHMIKTWFEDGCIIQQIITEAESYKREWVGLTDEEEEHIVDAYWNDTPMFIEAIEAKLKEKNT